MDRLLYTPGIMKIMLGPGLVDSSISKTAELAHLAGYKAFSWEGEVFMVEETGNPEDSGWRKTPFIIEDFEVPFK